VAFVWCVGCDDGDPGDDLTTGSLWVRYSVENEVGLGTTAFAAFHAGSAEAENVELDAEDVVACNGKRLDLTVEAWSRTTFYKAIVSDLGAGGTYNFTLTRATGETYQESLALPSTVTVETHPSEVQPGTEIPVTLSPGTADELWVSVVAPCLAPGGVIVEGDAEEATIPANQVVCACAAGGNTPPCDGVIRAQRIALGEVGAEFAGGETVGLQRQEVDVAVLPE
jgi:hypothetical protein